MKKSLEQIAAEDGRYNIRAYKFVYDALGHRRSDDSDKPAHVSGQDLCQSMREMAVKKWGRLAKLVLNTWRIETTRDFGEIVYTMILNKWMSAQPEDSIDDFDDVFDFNVVFEEQFAF